MLERKAGAIFAAQGRGFEIIRGWRDVGESGNAVSIGRNLFQRHVAECKHHAERFPSEAGDKSAVLQAQLGPAQTRIDTGVAFAWTIDDQVLPLAKVPATGRFDLNDRAICGQDLDNGFEGWTGQVIMSDPEWPFELELSSPQARFFQIFSPSDGGFFVAEPVTHANAALNAPEPDWPGLGLRILDPGEEMRLDMRIEVRAK